ncbi:MAG: hypothetical protein GY765_33945 [bacterium]|nr:hypothetical protein [bacterium]
MTLTKRIIGIVVCLVLVSGFYAYAQCTKPCDVKDCPAKAENGGKMTVKQLLENFQKKTFTGEAIDLNLKDADLATVIGFFSKYTPLKVKVAPEVKGKVTVNRQKVAWDNVLFDVLNDNKLKMEEKNQVFVVGKK